jgi:hypothetical protein
VLYLAANPLTRSVGTVVEEEEAPEEEEEEEMSPYDPRRWAMQPSTGADNNNEEEDDDVEKEASGEEGDAIKAAGSDQDMALEGAEALVAAVAANPTIVTLSVRETGLPEDTARRLRLVWGDHRSSGDLLL